jgi:glycosyltransferase involved in cell wall biosynthesis
VVSACTKSALICWGTAAAVESAMALAPSGCPDDLQMNLVSTSRIGDLSPDRLPPERADGRMRLLNIGLPILGLSSFNRALHEYTRTREDVIAVHFELVNTPLMKCLFRVSPLPWCMDFQVFNMIYLWRRRLRWAIRPGGPLDLARFDAVVVCPHYFAMAFIDRRPSGRAFAICAHADSTVSAMVQDFDDSPITSWPLHTVDRFVFPRCDLITCMGWWAGNSARDHYGALAERVMLVPPTTVEIPIAPFEKASHAGRMARIVFLGNDWERKGGPELLRWHQTRWIDRAELHVIGASAPVDRTARNVTWHGSVPRNRVLTELLPSMDIMVMPTKRDMSPWAPVEALGCGVPVVSTRLAGIPDEVIDGLTGFLAPLRDERAFISAIETLLDDPDRCRAMGLAGREYARTHFSPSVVYGDLLSRIRGVLED